MRLLCTSQEALAVDREHVWLLHPLDEQSAVALFDERARSVRPDVADSADAVAEIVRRLDGLPLAIELAAARASTLSISEIAARMDDRFALLSARTRGRQPRHRASCGDGRVEPRRPSSPTNSVCFVDWESLRARSHERLQ